MNDALPVPVGRAPTLPLRDLASMVLGFTDRLTMAHDAGKRLGGVVRVPVPGRDVFLVSGPEAVSHVMIRNHANYTKSPDYQILAHLLGQGLLTSDDALWTADRRKVQPLFKRHLVERFATRILQCTHEMVDAWEGRDVVQLEVEMTRLTLRIIGFWLLGFDVDPYVERISSILDSSQVWIVKRGNAIVDWAALLPTLGQRRFERDLTELYGVMDTLLETYDARGAERQDLVTVLREAGKSHEAVRDHMLTFFLAGHETTAIALTWFFATLPDEWEQAIVDEVGEHHGPKGPVPGEVPDLPLTTRCLKEGMRLYPPVTFMGRQAREEDRLQGFPIPAGSLLALCPFATHRNPDVWPDPDRFDPDRFLHDVPAGAYYPFSLGPRRCVGRMFAYLELQSIASVVLSRYRLTLDPRVEGLAGVPLVSMRPNQPVWMRLEAR